MAGTELVRKITHADKAADMKRKFSWRTCPKCKSRATKIFSLNSGKLKCQICEFEYESPNKPKEEYNGIYSLRTKEVVL